MIFLNLKRPMNQVGFIFGVLMPIAMAFIYPTYANSMVSGFAEWTRLREIPILICEMTIILWSICRGMELREFTAKMPLDILIALALFIIAIFYSSSIVSEQPLTSLTISFGYLLHIIFAIALLSLLKNKRDEVGEGLAFWLCIGLLPLLAFTAWVFAFPPHPSKVLGGYLDWSAALPGFISVRHFGSWTGALMVLSASFVLHSTDKQKVRAWLACYFLSSFATIWSGTRAAILAFAIALTLQVVFARKIPKINKVGSLAIISGASCVLAVFFHPNGEDNFWLFNFGEAKTVNQFSSGRILLWKLTCLRWLDAPWWGLGSGSTYWEVFAGWRHTQPHNAVLQFLISWGIVGAIPAISIILRATYRAFSITKATPQLWPFFSSFVSLLIMSMLEGMLYYPRFITLMIVMCAVIFAHDRQFQRKSS